jgi:ribosomal protein L37AE/L43A
MVSVGRPPELDSNGNIVVKSLCNVTIPTKLANFLKEKGINRSKLFTDIVSKMFEEELCPHCYSEKIEETMIGISCRKCSTIIKNKNCENCKTEYHPPYNMFAQPADKSFLKGCYDCIPPEKRA